MIIYTETTLNYMLRLGMKAEVKRIVDAGIHRNRGGINYIIIVEE